MNIKRKAAALLSALVMMASQSTALYAYADGDDSEPHTHQYVSEVTKEATCAEVGELTYTCECGDTYSVEIPKTSSHKYGVGEVITKASCGVEGKTVYTCKICGASYTEITPALSHTLDNGEITKKPTCTEKGIKTYTCTLCGSTFDKELPIEPEAHDFGEGVVTKEADCSQAGEKTYTCAYCGETRYEEIPKTNDHHFDEGEVTTIPTCGKTGIKTYTCSVCGSTKGEKIPSTGLHYFGKAEIIKEADCTHAGLKRYTCSGCGMEVNTVIPKSSIHKFDGGAVTKAATTTSTGIKTYTCTLCGKKITKTIPKLIDISKCDITLSATSYKYNGAARKPTVTVKYGSKTLSSTTDYTVSYSNNTNAGTATVKITGKGAYTSTVKKYFTIKTVALSSATITGINMTYTYTGSKITPEPKIVIGSRTLIKGTDYTVAYTSNTAIGTATVTITAKGSYTGSKKITFGILPKATKVKALTSPKTKQLKVTWAKSPSVTGYQIVYSTNKSFSSKKTATVKGAATVSKTLSSLTAGKTYYVKIRCYKTIGSTNYYSSYSAVSSLKIK